MEEEAKFKGIASRLVTKWKQTYSLMCGYVKSRLDITLFRATHLYIRSSWVPAQNIRVQQINLEDGAILHIFL